MSERTVSRCVLVLIMLVNVMVLAPVLDTGYLQDDGLYESSAPGGAMLSEKTEWEMILDDVLVWISIGRWQPLIAYRIPIFFHLSLYGYKLLTILFVLSNILLFGHFVKLLSGSKWLAEIAMMLPPIFFQFRLGYNDPIAAYYYLMQIVFLGTLGSLVFFTHYLRNGRLIRLLAALFFYATAMLAYEVAYVFWILHVIVAFIHFGSREPKRIMRASAPFFLAAVINLTISLILRWQHSIGYSGVALNLDAWAMAAAFLKQTYGALPLTSFLHNADAFPEPLGYARHCWPADLFAATVLWATVWYLICRSGMDQPPIWDQHKTKGLLLIGLALLVLPALPVCASVKYQQELNTWGLAYLPVYMSCFGLMAIAASAVGAVSEQLRSTPAVRYVIILVLTLLGAAVTGINYNANRIAVENVRHPHLVEQGILESALHNHLMKGVPNGSVVMVPVPRGAKFFKMHGDVIVKVVWVSKPEYLSSANFIGMVPLETTVEKYRTAAGLYMFPDDLHVYYLKCSATGRNSGYALLARVSALSADKEKVRGVASDRVRIYWHDAPICNRKPHSAMIVGKHLSKATFDPEGSFETSWSFGTDPASAGTGRIYELAVQGKNQCFDVLSMTVFGCVDPVRASALSGNQHPD
ncbi:MAG: hypothetical protein AB1646_08010 [Thermodesulfobacteriota bacterium]